MDGWMVQPDDMIKLTLAHYELTIFLSLVAAVVVVFAAGDDAD